MQIEKPKSNEELLTLHVIRPGRMVDDRELEKRMRAAAEGKEKINGIVRRQGEQYNP